MTTQQGMSEAMEAIAATTTAWLPPLPLAMVPDEDPDGFRRHPAGTTGLPVGALHPGGFGFERANHVHEGVDLYCDPDTPVSAVEDGVVVAIIAFTGAEAEPPSPWWHDTDAVLVEGASGVVVYGEVAVGADVRVGTRLAAGETFARVVPVLRKDKGRPMTMLHLELHEHSTRDAFEWTIAGGRPPSLRDPTPLLLAAAETPGEALGRVMAAAEWTRIAPPPVGETLDRIMAAATAGEALDAIPDGWDAFLSSDERGWCCSIVPKDAVGVARRIWNRGYSMGTAPDRLGAMRVAVRWLRERTPIK